VCTFNYVRDVNDHTVFAFTYARGSRTIGTTIDLDRIGSGMYNITWSENIHESIMATPYENKFVGKITFSDKPVDIDNNILNMMNKAETLLENYDKIVQEYTGPFFPDSTYSCEKLAVYDGFYEVLIYLKRQEFEVMGVTVYQYTFDHIELETDNETCWVNISADGRLTMDRHCEKERLEEKIEAKYNGVYSCLSECEYIMIYDTEFSVYVILEQGLGQTYLYEYSDYSTKYDPAVYCFGTIDGNNNILLSTHAQLEMLQHKYADYGLLGADDCEAFSIYNSESRYYMVYYFEGNNHFYVGYAPFQVGCLAVVDDASTTIRLLTHINHEFE
jgi:hypothetical protein